jgi:hypothetical protein
MFCRLLVSISFGASNIRTQVGLFAAWLPNAEIKIGHYGPLDGALFQPLEAVDGCTANWDPQSDIRFQHCCGQGHQYAGQGTRRCGVTKGNVLSRYIKKKLPCRSALWML